MSGGKEIERLISEVALCEQKLFGAKQRLIAARCRHIGIAVDDVVRDAKGREFRVVRAKFLGNRVDERPWLEGVPRRKDGEWANREQCIYDDWTKVES